MKLNDVIVWLEEEFGADSDARVEVIPSQTDALSGERTPVPVRDVSVDASDEEAHLLVNAPPWEDAAAARLQ